MADMAEIAEAVATLRRTGVPELTVLQCVSNYPADPAHMNLRVMETYARTFGVTVGLSDHTLGIGVAIAAVGLGARCIEKHFTLDRTLPGPDHQASLEPADLRTLTASIRQAEVALGDGIKRVVASEVPVQAVARKSVVVARNLPAGAVLGPDDLVILRPGTGLSPAHLGRVLGRRTARAIAAQTPLTEEMLEPAP
jgi:sialic acid synthase SpsE